MVCIRVTNQALPLVRGPGVEGMGNSEVKHWPG